jgi:hypothetical protein
MAAYRDDVVALDARHAALSHEVATKTRELADAARLLDDAKSRARLPVLDNIRVATPCSADWAKMTGDERSRACGDCNKNVYNISNLTREEAQALIVEKEGKLCVRYYKRHDGTILLKDCSIGVGQKRKRKLIAAGAAALLAGIGGWIVLASRKTEAVEPGCNLPLSYMREGEATTVTAQETAPHHDYEATMGDMAY